MVECLYCIWCSSEERCDPSQEARQVFKPQECNCWLVVGSTVACEHSYQMVDLTDQWFVHSYLYCILLSAACGFKNAHAFNEFDSVKNSH